MRSVQIYIATLETYIEKVQVNSCFGPFNRKDNKVVGTIPFEIRIPSQKTNKLGVFLHTSPKFDVDHTVFYSHMMSVNKNNSKQIIYWSTGF